MNTEKVLLGALAGFATGALFGVLFAPYKGKELRGKISQGTLDYASDLKAKFSNYVDSLSEKMDMVKDEAGNLVDQGKSALDHGRKDIKAATQGQGQKSNLM